MDDNGHVREERERRVIDVRAGFISFNLINETEIIVITNASHALDISKGTSLFVIDVDFRE